ncbi:2-hydroxyacid dehydrogenase [Wohlfahrtiimonas chitiniclastica]|uniref:2-hydroxyacid dehydrogenase n=1 Tax=Wohlfahrtiimonas chitiniclastica TaxID=400946 RepID=UPI0007B69C83|nr:glyoxylate/hydroxypyruvate reductase A [Wohlfahrtiimonas chitiniclastica]KZX37030.1 glyoxylate/hydroxypyruvate reductase A [Wohlfahrtiimonas chitiniclastica]
MAILCLSTVLPNFNQWIKNLHAIDPTLDLRTKDNPGDLSEITSVLAWKANDEDFKQLPNLKFVQSTGMGIDHILECKSIPEGTIIARIVDHDMKEQMAEYALYGALKACRNMQYYNRDQVNKEWHMRSRILPKDLTIGVLGLGELGSYVANTLKAYGFNVIGWKNTPPKEKDASIYHGQDQLPEFLSQCNILVCLLPLTPETQHILNRDTFAMLPKGAYLINPARGGHVKEADLLEAIQSGHISGALLDVFDTEPLPKDHPFWDEAAIEITPHVAAMTNPITASEQVAENFRLVREGKLPNNLVDLNRGY